MDGSRTENSKKKINKNTGHKIFEKGNNGQTSAEGLYSRVLGPSFGCYALEDQEEEGVEYKIIAKQIVDVKNI
jgi:hypothetical protein